MFSGAKREKPKPTTPIPDEDHIFVDDVKKSFGSTHVIHGITMHLRRQETAVIIGGSGAFSVDRLISRKTPAA